MKTLEIIFVCFAAFLTAIVTYKWKDVKTVSKITLIVIIIAAILVAINSFRQNSKEALIERINAKFGEIEGSFDGSEPQMRIGNSDSGATLILAGSGVFDFDPFGPLIKLNLEDGKIVVNTVIRNLEGEVIATIEDNTWTLFKEDFEYNDDNKTAFEIVTKGERKVFFQIELKGGVACVSGHLLNDKGFGFFFCNPPPEINGSIMYAIKTNESKSKIPDFDIPRIFKYPREKYYGLRD